MLVYFADISDATVRENLTTATGHTMFIIPVEGKNLTKHGHLSLWLVAFTCVLVAVLRLFSGPPDIFATSGFVPASPSVETLFSSMFLHAGLLHLIGNLFFLIMFGDNIEDVLGHSLFLISYLFCGAAAALGYMLLHPDSQVQLVGASGAISGILGMYLVFFPRVAAKLSFYAFHREIRSIKTTVLVAIGGWFALQLLLVLLVEMTSIGDRIRIAFSAHIAGFLAGIVVGGFFVSMGCMKNYVSRRKSHWLFGYCIRC